MLNKLNISAAIIYDSGDIHYLRECLQNIPQEFGLVLCQTIPIPEGQALPKHDITRLSDRTCNAKYYYRENEFSFSEARNFANTLVTTDWIISLDADDKLLYLEEDFLQLATLPADIGGVNVLVVSHCPQIINVNQLEIEAAWQIKIYRNNTNIKYVYSCHESVNNSIISNGLRIVPSDIIIKHTGYINATPEKMEEKMIRNYKLLSKDILIYKDDKYINKKYIETLKALAMKHIYDKEQCI
jgi:hypothetical protein